MQQRVQRTETATAEADAPYLRLNVSLADGGRFAPPAAAGFRVMELLKMYGLPIKAECGGAGVCSTCHIRIPARWQDALLPPSDEEQAKLDEIPGADDTSRLACQLVMTEDMDGLELEVQPDSLLPQTSWAAG